MKITIIGCDGTYAGKNGATSAYLIEDKDTKVLLDLGSGSMARLQNHIELRELDGIIISHYHRDHFADLECMQFAVMVDTFEKVRTEPLVIYGPGDEQKLTYKKMCIGKTFKKKDSFNIGTLTFTTQLNRHGIEAYSIKVCNEEGKNLVYTGDTSYFKELASFCKNTECLIAEASLFKAQKDVIPGHMTSVEAATVAKEANVKSLVLTHLPHYGDLEQLIEEAKEVFDGEVLLARYDLVIEL